MSRLVQRTPEPANPRAPHGLVEPSGTGIGTFAAGVSGSPSAPGFAPAAMTGAYLRADHRCALPGCGKSRGDDVHARDE